MQIPGFPGFLGGISEFQVDSTFSFGDAGAQQQQQKTRDYFSCSLRKRTVHVFLNQLSKSYDFLIFPQFDLLQLILVVVSVIKVHKPFASFAIICHLRLIFSLIQNLEVIRQFLLRAWGRLFR